MYLAVPMVAIPRQKISVPGFPQLHLHLNHHLRLLHLLLDMCHHHHKPQGHLHLALVDVTIMVV